MRLYRLALAVMLFALVFAGCDNPGPPTADWCYTYDFTEADPGFSLIYGSWVAGFGLVADGSGRLVGSFVYEQDVYPSYVSVTVARVGDPLPDPRPILNLQANALIFGVPITIPGVTMAEDVDEQSAGAQNDDPANHGSVVNATVQGSAPYAVTMLTISGSGLSPFPDNPCATEITSTPTPFIATDAPTSTTAPTYTPSPSDTPSPTPSWSPTPTPTPTVPPCWNPVDLGGGTYRLSLDFDCPSPLYYETDGEITVSGHVGNGLYNPTGDLTLDVYLQPGMTGYYQYGAYMKGSVGASSYAVYWQRKPRGGSWSSLQLLTFISTTYGPYFQGNLSVLTTDIEAVRFNLQSNTHTMAMWLDDFSIVYAGSYETLTPTPSSTSTASLTSTPVTPTWTDTRIVTAFPTGTPQATGTPTRTRVPVGIYTVPPLGTLPPPLTAWATSTIDYTATAFASGTITPGADGTLVHIPWDGGGDGGGPGDTAVGIGEIGRAVLGFGFNAMNQAFGFARTLGSTVTEIVTVWNNAQPVAIQGLPNCVGSARLQSELCAIYYILTYTIFSGTLGQLLIPIATVIVGMVLIFTFIKRARAIAARIAEINKT